MLAFGMVEKAAARARLIPAEPPEFAMVPGLKTLCQTTRASVMAIEDNAAAERQDSTLQLYHSSGLAHLSFFHLYTFWCIYLLSILPASFISLSQRPRHDRFLYSSLQSYRQGGSEASTRSRASCATAVAKVADTRRQVPTDRCAHLVR